MLAPIPPAGRPCCHPSRRRRRRRPDPAQPARRPDGPACSHSTATQALTGSGGHHRTNAPTHAPAHLHHHARPAWICATPRSPARYADPRTIMRYDRARTNLDRPLTTSSPPSCPPALRPIGHPSWPVEQPDLLVVPRRAPRAPACGVGQLPRRIDGRTRRRPTDPSVPPSRPTSCGSFASAQA